jgi:hypothetical protein
MALGPHAALWLRAHSSAACTLAAMWAAERRFARRWHSGHGPGRACLGQDLGGSRANRRGVTGADSDLTAVGFIIGGRGVSLDRERCDAHAARALSCPYAAYA